MPSLVDETPSRPLRNPFTTRYTRPGRVPPRDGGGLIDPGSLLDRVRTLGAGAIEGPHGSGKTTLLVALAARAGRAELLRARRRRDAATVLRAIRAAGRGTVFCVDCWERLGTVGATAVRVFARLRRCPLVVTTHRASGLPVLVRTRPTVDILAAIVAGLPDHGGLIGTRDVEEAFAAHGGNLREALYDLYDRFERRAR
jgi:hypothetical protein